MQRKGALYTVLFSGLVCIVCSVMVSTAAVALKPRQEQNLLLDRRKNVLEAAGLKKAGEKLSRQQIQTLYDKRVRPIVIDLATGDPADIKPESFDMQTAMEDPETSKPAPENPAQVLRLPKYALVYEILDEQGKPEEVVLPIQGKGLWSTLFGYLAVDKDGNTIRGITYYQHGETPGLGGEVENPRWKALWQGRRIYGPQGQPQIEVIKGSAGPPEQDPYKVDGLSGATITSRGVTNMLHFWLGETGFEPFLKKYPQQRS